MKKFDYIYLFFIIVLGLSLRLWNIDWDAGFHLHPDERAIILFTLPLQFPPSLQDFFLPTSPWNPHFFAYGSFPLYLLKTLGSLGSFFDTTLSLYDGIYRIGRVLSALFDTATLIVLFFLVKKLCTKNVALLAAFFYAISVLPIQLSHFYAVDTILTFFILFLLFQLIRFYEHPTKQKAIGIGILFGFALATKTSAFVLIASILITIGIDFFFLFLKQPHKPTVWFPHIPLFLKRLCIDGFLILLSTFVVFFLLEPYAFIDYKEFWMQTLQQSAMTKSAFTFPYTLQYVGKLPYVYEIKNIILWGLGPLLGISSLFGLLFYHAALVQNRISFWQKQIILISFFWIYFLLVGNFAIGFMRYMIPLYPFFCFFAAYLIYSLFVFLNQKSYTFSFILLFIYIFSTLIWTFSFMHIYQNPPTRLQATEWILKKIPSGKTLAIEHWDDALPLFEQGKYKIETLELYSFDNKEKWLKINKQLANSDYIILASNRLYTPLQNLTYCNRLPYLYCYTQTAQYYKQLFAEKNGFTKVAEFAVYPKIPLLNISIDDTTADESFTVYDHPKVIIFKKNTKSQ